MTESYFETITGNLIREIESEQIKSGTKEVSAGLFPSYRENKMLFYHRTDENIFFTTIICFVLKSLKDRLPSIHWDKIDSIMSNAQAALGLFRNKDDRPTYNFYRTRPSNHFPNGYFLNRFDFFRLPDDADDTVMVNLVFGSSTEEKQRISELLSKHSNGETKWNQSFFHEIRSLKAYSTWFGKNMRVEFDVCVISNVLLWKYHSGLKWNENDHDSIRLLQQVIEKKYWITDPFTCAPNYPRPELILYHLARLVHEVKPPQLPYLADELLSAAIQLLKSDLHPMNQLLIQTSLMKLGYRSQTQNWIPAENFLSLNTAGFSFFIAGMLTAFDLNFISRVARNSLVHIHWVCPAFHNALILENLVLDFQLNKETRNS
ncbi:MAG: hypothetical protein LCH54_12870 [Bacteroidetes bacterium]|nr:hypothetical protein [Bacteroidota bacterium]